MYDTVFRYSARKKNEFSWLEPRGASTGDGRNEIGIARQILGAGWQLKLLHVSETIPDAAVDRRLMKQPAKDFAFRRANTRYAAVLAEAPVGLL